MIEVGRYVDRYQAQRCLDLFSRASGWGGVLTRMADPSYTYRITKIPGWWVVRGYTDAELAAAAEDTADVPF